MSRPLHATEMAQHVTVDATALSSTLRVRGHRFRAWLVSGRPRAPVQGSTAAALSLAKPGYTHLRRRTVVRSADESQSETQVQRQENGSVNSQQQKALQALDRQLADLASGKRPQRVGDTIGATPKPETRFRAGQDSRPLDRPSMPSMLGRDASPEGWPEFDATFFVYSSLALLVISALTNWGYNALFLKSDPALREAAAIERQERQARMSSLYRQVLEDAPEVSETANGISGAELSKTLKRAFDEVVLE